jgi:outer membrane protein TolC
MSDRFTSRLRTTGLVILSVLALSVQAAQPLDQAPKAENNATSTVEVPTPSLGILSADGFLRLLVARSVEIQYSKLNTDVTRHLREGEASMYEPTAYMGLRKEGRNRQRTPDERLQNTFTSGTAILDENARSNEIGIRSKLPTGAEVTLSYKESGKNNNLISQTSAFDTEYTTLLNLTLKQPLLRNAGRSITETDRRIAELEYKVALEQLIQQTLKSSIDGLNLYWQLHRAQETYKLRLEAVSNTEALIADANARVAAGKLPANAVLELRGVMLNRQAELARSQQALHDAQGKLSTAINITWNEADSTGTAPQLHASDSDMLSDIPTLEEMLNLWSPYQIALLKQKQAQTRLNFAKNQSLPLVDFVMSYGGTGFNNNLQDASKLAMASTYPDWYVGVNIEVPIGGNQKAKEQFLAQSARLTQSELELQAIRNSFTNDMSVRLGDLKNALGILELSHKEIKLRQNIFDNERQRVQIGSGSLSNLIQKQVDLIESKQRLLENQVRYEVARAMWQYTRGSLLTDNGIQVSDQSVSKQ